MKNPNYLVAGIAKRCFLLFGFLMFFSLAISAQDQKLADSLEQVYLEKIYDSNEELILLKELAENQPDTEKKLNYCEVLIQKATASNDDAFLFSGYLQRGNALRLKGDFPAALESYFQGASIAIKKNERRDLGRVNIAIADIYSLMDNHEEAVRYYRSSVKALEAINDSVGLASALLNTGDEYYNIGKLDSALMFFKESGDLFEVLNFQQGIAYNLGNVGLVYAKKGENRRAEENINAAVEVLKALGDYYPICVYLAAMSDIYAEKGNGGLALNFAKESYDLALEYGLKQELSDASQQLSKLYEQRGNASQALSYYKKHITFRDSVNNISTVEKLANVRADFQVEQKQIEVDFLSQKRRTQRIVVITTAVALFLIALLAFFLYRRNRVIEETNKLIDKERQISDRLLLNILPEGTADELKVFGKVKAKKFDSVSVMFTDFKEFSSHSSVLSPELLVKSVDFYYSKFDEIIDKYDLEKIKTIGDSYMCAGGLPIPSKDHAVRMILAALEIEEFVTQAKQEDHDDLQRFDIRIGINTGPVVAGVVGTKKFAYDIWGDSVNIAARMEANSVPGKINVSQNTYDVVKDMFDLEYRGEVEVKHGILMKMYFVNGVKNMFQD